MLEGGESPSPPVLLEKPSSIIDTTSSSIPSPLQPQTPTTDLPSSTQNSSPSTNDGDSDPKERKEDEPFLFSCLLCGFECDHLSSLYIHLQTPPHTVQICPPQFTNPKVRIADWVKPKQEAPPPPPKAFRSILSDMNFSTYEELETHARSSPHTAGSEKRKRGGIEIKEDIVYDCGHSDLSGLLEKDGSISLPHLSSADSVAGRVFTLGSRAVYEGAEIVDVESSSENNTNIKNDADAQGGALGDSQKAEGGSSDDGQPPPQAPMGMKNFETSLQERVAKRIKKHHPEYDTETLLSSTSTSSAVSPSPSKAGEQGQLHTCTLCKIHCYTKVNFEQHIKGKRHLTALQKSRERQERHERSRDWRDRSPSSRHRSGGNSTSRDRGRDRGRDHGHSHGRDRHRSPSPHRSRYPPSSHHSHHPPSSHYSHSSYPPPHSSYPPSYPSHHHHSSYPPPSHAPPPANSYPPNSYPPASAYPSNAYPPASAYPPSNSYPPTSTYPPNTSYPPSNSYHPPHSYPPNSQPPNTYTHLPYPSSFPSRHDPNQPHSEAQQPHYTNQADPHYQHQNPYSHHQYPR